MRNNWTGTQNSKNVFTSKLLLPVYHFVIFINIFWWERGAKSFDPGRWIPRKGADREGSLTSPEAVEKCIYCSRLFEYWEQTCCTTELNNCTGHGMFTWIEDFRCATLLLVHSLRGQIKLYSFPKSSISKCLLIYMPFVESVESHFIPDTTPASCRFRFDVSTLMDASFAVILRFYLKPWVLHYVQ